MTLTVRSLSGGDLDLYLTAPSCSGYPPNSCTLLAVADGPGGTETITRTVNAGEAFSAHVDNFETRPIQYELTLSVR